MKNIVASPFWTAMLVAAVMIGSAHAGAASAASGDKPAASAKKKAKAGSGGQVRFLPGSAETAKERGSRLKRECHGQVNAGACAGYTR
ncbi:MAG: hypothetical protein JWP79_1811 [Polaromonas sp.]|jgi:hypothetical protein|nr:hypothetical protein [Polaromonas sp.]MDB5844501.1 hypothetical protein [Polaromonas sp.]MDB5939864.1 hypothetical protein [Polaromonas sp.]